MAPTNLKPIALVVQLPIELAEEIFHESGNLAISEFPAILEFAESLAKILNFNDEEDGEYSEPTWIVKKRESILVSARRKK